MSIGLLLFSIGIPFETPISEVRVARINGKFIINPSYDQLAEADIDMMIGASLDSVAMVEGEMDEVSEEEMAEAIKFAHEAIKVQCEAQVKLAEAVGKKETREYEGEREDEGLAQKIHEFSYQKNYDIAKERKFQTGKGACFFRIKRRTYRNIFRRRN